jgi:hypothetical protein
MLSRGLVLINLLFDIIVDCTSISLRCWMFSKLIRKYITTRLSKLDRDNTTAHVRA